MRSGSLVMALMLVGCSVYDDLSLLDVTGVDPSQVEPGGTLRIRGEGFPLGLPAEVTLTGDLHRPGLVSTSIDARVVGEVQTETLIEIPIDDALIGTIGGRGTLEGRLRLSFRAANDRRDVFADRPIVLDFLPDTSVQLGTEPRGNESPSPVDADHFGVELSREESGHVGVRVDSVDPTGVAAVQGVQAGDVVIGLDGLRLYSWKDFLPDPTKTESLVLVSRAGLDGVHGLRWPHEATVERADSLSLVVLVVLGLILGWLSPLALCFGNSSRTSIEVWLTRASLVLVFSAALFCVSFLQSTTVWILMIGLLAALFSLATRNRVAAVSFGFVVGSTLTVMVLARTASMGALVAAQEGTVLNWYVLQTPASTLAFAAYLYALQNLTSQTRLSASLYTTAATVLGAVLFLGGWEAADPVEAIALLVVKSSGLFLIARFFRLSHSAAYVISGLAVALALLGAAAGDSLLLPYWNLIAAGCTVALITRTLLRPLNRPSAPVVV